MAYCSKCGKELEDDSLTICPECSAQEAKEVVTPTMEAKEAAVPTKEEKTSKMGGLGIASLVLGILGIVLNLVLAILGHILCITGICLGAKEKSNTGNKVGFIICIIGEVLAVINSILGVILQMR